MDGLKYVIPMSCTKEKAIIKGEVTLFETKDDTVVEKFCEGCVKKASKKHNGIYVKIRDWVNNKTINFVDIIGKP